MADTDNPSDVKEQPGNNPASDNQQEKTDPNLTELKGFTDSNEKLEPKAEEIDSEKKQ